MAKQDIPDQILSQDPTIDATSFIASGAQVMGDVRCAAFSSIWYNCVLRGDINYIEIGQRTNIQDLSMIHLENDRPCVVGDDVTVGHRAVLHGCEIEDACLIGMGAVVLNGAVIKTGAVVGAGAVVKEEMIVEPYSLVVGVPARVVKVFDPSIVTSHQQWAAKYVELAKQHRAKFK